MIGIMTGGKIMDYRGKKIAVIGAGKSGIAAAALLEHEGALPFVYDEGENFDADAAGERLRKALVPYGIKESVTVFTGGLPSDEEISSFEIAVFSPGVPLDTPFAEKLKAKGVKISGEIELAYTCAKGRLIAITGTNGKTTTTALTGKICADHFGKSFVVGNIGDPYTDAAAFTKDGDVTVAEISSFQLESTDLFHPQVCAILNITPDHLNRHHTMENYIACKERITERQSAEDVCVLNYDDPYTKEFGSRCKSSVIFFSGTEKLKDGYFLDGDMICRAYNGEVKSLMNVKEMKLKGKHNAENVMAAMAMTESIGVPMEEVIATVREFNAVEHRIEFVRDHKGVEYFNDSKGTNPDAAIKAVEAMDRPTVVIGGGYDKQSTYDEWIESFDGHVKALVLIGATADKIEECARSHGFDAVYRAESLKEAVKISASLSKEGDAVLLSPACASWDMFKNYEERGRQFKEYVRGLE